MELSSCVVVMNSWANIDSCAVARSFCPKVNRKRLCALSKFSLCLLVGVQTGHCRVVLCPRGQVDMRCLEEDEIETFQQFILIAPSLRDLVEIIIML